MRRKEIEEEMGQEREGGKEVTGVGRKEGNRIGGKRKGRGEE